MIFDLDPSRKWLFCMTHPDDELTICAWIRTLVRNGNDVFISWTHSAEEREKEARNGAKLVGVPEPNLRFFGAPDTKIAESIPALLPKFRAMIDEISPDVIVCGAFEQGHMDHDATNYIVNRVFEGPIYEVPFYHTYDRLNQTLNRFSDSRGEEIWDLDQEDRAFKVEMAKQFPSQTIWQILWCHEMVRLITLRKAELVWTERMRRQIHRDFRTPNHPPLIAERVLRTRSWERWVRAVRIAEGDPNVGPEVVAPAIKQLWNRS